MLSVTEEEGPPFSRGLACQQHTIRMAESCQHNQIYASSNFYMGCDSMQPIKRPIPCQ